MDKDRSTAVGCIFGPDGEVRPVTEIKEQIVKALREQREELSEVPSISVTKQHRLAFAREYWKFGVREGTSADVWIKTGNGGNPAWNAGAAAIAMAWIIIEKLRSALDEAMGDSDLDDDSSPAMHAMRLAAEYLG